MTKYFIRRFLLMFPTFIGLTILVFFILDQCPGNIVDQEIQRIQAGGTQSGEVSGGRGSGGVKDIAKIRRQLEKYYGFDQPFIIRYAKWLWKLVPFKFEDQGSKYFFVVDSTDGKQQQLWLLIAHVDVQEQMTLIKKQQIAAINQAPLPNNFTKREPDTTHLIFKAKQAFSLLQKELPQYQLQQTHKIATQEVKGMPVLTAPDMGNSYKKRQPVFDLIIARLPVSITLGLFGFFLSYLICIPLGVMKAVKHGGKFDFASSAMIFVAYSIPGWALGVVLLAWLGGTLKLFPLGGLYAPGFADLSVLDKIVSLVHHAALPVCCYMLGSFATLTILMKNSLMENLGADYVRTAFAKGLSEKRVIFLHALRNSMIPIATGMGHAISLILAGSYLIEKVFNINGFGLLGFTAIENRDYPIALGILVFGSILKMLGNILADILYCIFDPRIRFE